ncbi:type VI secretion system tube protein TssD [Hymenobacter terrenus]|uniref:type VI secretion system tube protein TssD n=1 Tax=Hymenobacter terrenus TaxID=1629124 RepID=UPI000619289A|nr:type VI secretion system tube protein TssD [Hymenobacter terrenus]
MASFSAELHVEGYCFPVLHCTYQATQATDARGRIIEKIRRGAVKLTLDVPEVDILSDWGNEPRKRLAAALRFRDAEGRVLETLRLPAAYCVGYDEDFRAGNTELGAYVCDVVLADPDGWTWHPGDPDTTFVTPVPGEHGTPVELKQEVNDNTTSSSISKLTAELPQRGYEEPTNPVEPRRMALWMGYLERRGVKFEIGTPVAELKLFDSDAVGIYAQHSRTIYLLHPPNVAAFFEEAFHALQHLNNHLESKILEDGTVVDAWEYDAKRALLTHSTKLGLSYEGYVETEKQLQQVIDGSYDNQ